MNIVVFTAALGKTDTVRVPIAVDPTVRYVCFSDRPCVAPYEHIETETTDRPQFAARQIKILADHPILKAADAILWHDASYQLLRPLRWVVKGLGMADVVAMRHPRRSKLEDEAIAIARYGYVTPAEADAAVRRYRAAGFLDNVVTASGLIGRRVSSAVAAFNAIWWREVSETWRGRDQGSIDFAMWSARVGVHHLRGTVRSNKYAGWRPVGVRV